MTHGGINENLKNAKEKLFSRKGPEKEKNRKLASLIPSRAMLIVGLKDQVEVWASEIRNLTHSRLLVYTDALAKRRQIGAHNLAQYDVVITTFDVSAQHHPPHLFFVLLEFSLSVCFTSHSVLFILQISS